MMGWGRTTLMCCALLVLLALDVGPALGSVGRGLVASFGPEGPGSSTFSSVEGVAVDQATGDVYVYDREVGGGSIYKFTAAGEPAPFAGLTGTTHPDAIEGVGRSTPGAAEIAVDSSTGPAKGDIYVADEAATVGIYNAAGEAVGSLNAEVQSAHPEAPWGPAVFGVATDPSGDVYVGLYGGEVNRYVPTANPASNSDYVGSLWSVATGAEVGNLAADTEGAVYVARYPFGPIFKYLRSEFNTSGTPAISTPPETSFDNAGSTLAVASAPAGRVFIDEQSDIAEYESSGTRLGSFATSGLGNLSFGLGIAGTTGTVYASDVETNTIEVFGLGNTPPPPSTLATDGVTDREATFHGALHPEGESLDYYFSYNVGTNCTGPGSSTTSVDNGGGAITGGVVEEAATVQHLQGGTEYAVCLVAQNGFGATPGNAERFSTLPQTPLPIVTGLEATHITQRSASLAGIIDPNGADTTYQFSYGSSSLIPEIEEDIGAGILDVPTSAELKNLAPNTTYGYTLRARHEHGEDGEATSPEQFFTTLPEAPMVRTLGPGEVNETEAVVYGAVTPPEADTKFRFEYGPTEEYGSTTPEIDAGATPGSQDVSASLPGLTPGSVYHFRLVASTTGGTTIGGDATFSTPLNEPYPAVPTATTGRALSVASSTASLVGTVDPSGSQTTYWVEYGTTSFYGSESSIASAVGGGATEVAAAVSGLAPATAYHWRLVANGPGGTSYGEDATFSTLPALISPSPAPPPATLRVAPKPKPASGSEKLAKALGACKRVKVRVERKKCEATARKHYKPKTKTKTKKRK